METKARVAKLKAKLKAQSSKLKGRAKGQGPRRDSRSVRSSSPTEQPCRDRCNEQRVRLPRPVRHERGEGRGEGCSTIPSGPTLRSTSSPRPSPPFRTEEREPAIPVRTARTAHTPPLFPRRQRPAVELKSIGFLALPLSFELYPLSFPPSPTAHPR